MRVVFLLTLCTAPLSAQPKYVVVKKDEATISATATFTFDYPRFRVSEWVLFAADAPNHDGQREMKSTLLPGGKAAKEAGEPNRSLLRARVSVTGLENRQELTVSLNYAGTLVKRALRLRKDGEAVPTIRPLTEAERKQFTAATKVLDFQEPAFKKWADKLPDTADPLEYARAAFDLVRKSAEYEFRPVAVKTASQLCVKPKTDCGGIATLFVAAMRNKGIPARLLLGRWAISEAGTNKLGDTSYFQWHVTTEFYADGIGWIPVDVAQAVTAKNEAQAVDWFGNDFGNFITFHIDMHLKVDTALFGTKVVSDLQNVHLFVKGEGELGGLSVKQKWEIQKK
jgi:hypothetical protein